MGHFATLTKTIIHDKDGDAVDAIDSAPVGDETGLVVRNIDASFLDGINNVGTWVWNYVDLVWERAQQSVVNTDSLTVTIDATSLTLGAAPIALPRAIMTETLGMLPKEALFFYTIDGDIDRIETTLENALKKKVDTFAYSGGNLLSITSAIVDI